MATCIAQPMILKTGLFTSLFFDILIFIYFSLMPGT